MVQDGRVKLGTIESCMDKKNSNGSLTCNVREDFNIMQAKFVRHVTIADSGHSYDGPPKGIWDRFEV